uniref:CSON009150 protein n=1 Tax=Culicoides sonorensis TaxID=179676 RepID=A0A336K339_CULSO
MKFNAILKILMLFCFFLSISVKAASVKDQSDDESFACKRKVSKLFSYGPTEACKKRCLSYSQGSLLAGLAAKCNDDSCYCEAMG